MHAPQRAFVEDMRQGVRVRAGRGGGKSYGMMAKFHRPSAAHPGCSSVFVTISAERSRDILLPAMWKMNDRFQLGITERRKDNALVWPNGYRVMMRGCKDRTECNKRRGTPWVVAGWDECDSINPKLLEYDLHDCVEPRLMDYKGQWFVGGTPGTIPQGYWFKLSSGNADVPLHTWDARHNPHIEALQFFIRTLQRMQGVPERKSWPEGITSLAGIIQDPKHWHLLPARFVREYLGAWVIDLTALIYKITPANTYATLPIEPDTWTIGIDLGANGPENEDLDHAAYAVCASHSSLPFIWVAEAKRMPDITLETLAARISQLLEKYPQANVHIDSASAGKIIEKTYQRMGLPIQHALKGPKLRRIQLMQGKVQNRNLQLHITETMDLRSEAVSLVWDDTRTTHSPKCADDCWDACMYAALPHFGDYEPEENAPAVGGKEWQRQQEMEEYEAALQEAMDVAA